MDVGRVDPVTVPCLECGLELAGDSPELRLELTCDDVPLVYSPSAGSEGSATSRPELWLPKIYAPGDE